LSQINQKPEQIARSGFFAGGRREHTPAHSSNLPPLADLPRFADSFASARGPE